MSDFDSGVTNQGGSPAILQRPLASRPATAIPGTLFISTEASPVFQRWSGSAWINITPGSGGVPSTRALTIAGVTQDLSANRTWLALAPGGNTYGINFKVGTNDNFTMAFKTNGIDRLTFDTAGTSTFSTATINITAGASATIGTTDSNALLFKTNNTTRVTIGASTGNVTFTGSLLAQGTVRVGLGTGAIADNLAVGVLSLNANTTGSGNTGIGFHAGQLNTTGTANTFVGADCGQASNADSNTGIGRRALRLTTSGTLNTAGGASALTANTTGGSNTGFGFSTLASITTTSNNTAIGYRAGFSALGSNNIFIGMDAGFNETGSNKLYIDVTATTTPLIGGDFSARTVTLDASIQTQAASVNGAGVYKFGKYITGGVVVDATHYVEMLIDGVLRKIITAV